MGAVSQVKRIIICVSHLNPPIANRPVQAGAGEDGPILRW